MGALAAPAKASSAADGREPRTIYVVGDSTALSYAVTEVPRAGWGQALPVFLDPKTLVVNEAVSASSSKSFSAAGRLNRILAVIRPRDVLLISFGHGDQSENPSRHTDPWTTFQDYLQLYIDGARATRALPVLVTPVERRRFTKDGVPYLSHGEYPDAMRALAAATRTPLIDLSALSFALWSSLGPEATKDYFLEADDTHLQARGAIEVARLVVSAGWMLPGRDRRALREPDISADLLVRPATRPGPDPL
ncbi:rhamnogalacturonan acetylesterase [Actinoplanes sp. CA-051413]|uniref:rhamnogalacturonan acetylesterase n=1 Tax=Actinoplanes sp. CA-051413 TaxID=3239899 RepID=UPI003D9965C1